MNGLEQFLHAPSMVLLGWSLVHFLWQGVIVALLVAAMLRTAARASAQTRYALAGGGMLVMLACPIITFTILLQHGPVPENGPALQLGIAKTGFSVRGER